jgi:hypothetical protein
VPEISSASNGSQEKNAVEKPLEQAAASGFIDGVLPGGVKVATYPDASDAEAYCGTGLKHCKFKASKGVILAMLLFLDQSDNHDKSPATQDHCLAASKHTFLALGG